MSGWIGYDLDATLAYWGDGHNTDVEKIGEPIPVAIARLKAELADGHEIRIVTARVASTGEPNKNNDLVDDDAFATHQRALIEAWCLEHIGQVLPVTATKDFRMWKLYDDRAVQVVPNTGEIALISIAGQIVRALDEPPSNHREPLHARVERECWKQHHRDFSDCEEPACVLLKRIAAIANRTVGHNGLDAPLVERGIQR